MSELEKTLKELTAELKLLRSSPIGNIIPLTDKWQWKQIKLKSKVPLPYSLLPGTSLTVVTDKELPSKKGFLHSVDLTCDGGDLYIEAVLYDPKGTEMRLEGILSDWVLAGFDNNMVMAGDPVVRNPGGGLPWIVRIGPSFNVPFNSPFSFTLRNKTAAVRAVLVVVTHVLVVCNLSRIMSLSTIPIHPL